MRAPWARVTRSREEIEAADRAVAAVRSHLRVLVTELEQTLDRIEDKARRLARDG